MKKLTLLLFILSLLSCEKNQPPTCQITQPQDNEEFTMGELITVSVEASDPDGLVAEVRLYFDHTGIASDASFPYNFEVNTTDYTVGSHTIKVTALDNEGLEGSQEISIRIVANIPSIAPGEITEITDSTALYNGNVLSDGGNEVSARGICWDTIQDPTLSNNLTVDGSGTGEFESKIGGLSCGTSYYVRAYATNEAGTAYGDQIVFSTPQCLTLPVVQTAEISNVSDSMAICEGIVINEGGTEVTSRGICWATSPEPTLSDNYTTYNGGAGQFASILTGLFCEVTYYVRAYATNAIGTAYGNEVSFTTVECAFAKDIDGNFYDIVSIGDQRWMADNLNVTRYADGTPIPKVESSSGWESLDFNDKAFCWYNNDRGNGYTYGAFYTWSAAMNGAESNNAVPGTVQGVCPTGWHLPSHYEWSQLEEHIGLHPADRDSIGWRGTNEGGKLKMTGTQYWNSPNTGATNETGFSSIPGGYRVIDGRFLYMGYYAIYWTATEESSTHSYYRHLVADQAKLGMSKYDKRAGLSVRCVKD